MWGGRPLCSLSQGQELIGFGVKRKPFYPSDCPAVLGLGQLRGVGTKPRPTYLPVPGDPGLNVTLLFQGLCVGAIGPNAANISGGWGPDEGASNRGGGQMFRRREESPTRHRRVSKVGPPLGKDAFHGRCMYPQTLGSPLMM